jgi:hypothetical protein
VRALGLLRIPEADIWAVCLGTGLGRDDARAALQRLTGIGLISLAGSGETWAMAPHVADYVRARALVAGQFTESEFERVLGPVIGMYGLRAANLRDLASASWPGPVSSLKAWAEEQWESERDGMAAVLGLAAASASPARARVSAAAFIDAEHMSDQQPRGWHEADRYLSPVLRIARAAGDHRLNASALCRLGCDAERRGELQDAARLLGAAREAARMTRDSQFIATIPAGPSMGSATDGQDPALPARTVPRDGLSRVEGIVSTEEGGSIPPLLFGAGAYLP